MRTSLLSLILLATQICFAQWVPVGLEDESVKDIAVYSTSILVVTSDSGKLYRSTDSEINWLTIVEQGVNDVEVSPSGAVFMLKDSVYNSGPTQLFLSTDDGYNWNYLDVIGQLADSFITGDPYNLKVSPTGTIFCAFVHTPPSRDGSWSTAIAVSPDNGATWSTRNLGGIIYDFRHSSVITIGIGGSGGGEGRDICLSEDGGFQWSCWEWFDGNAGTYYDARAISLCSNGNILAGAATWDFSGIILSKDTCRSWAHISTLSPDAGLSIESGGWLVGNDGFGVFLFSDDGDSLGPRNEGLTSLNVHTLTTDNNGYVYAGTDNGVWRRPLSEIVTSTEDISPAFPADFILSQNYPNPFNPTTTITYTLPRSAQVRLSVYNTLGEEVALLVSDKLAAGTHQTEWNASNQPSGVYFYRLQAEDFAQTRKLVLLK